MSDFNDMRDRKMTVGGKFLPATGDPGMTATPKCPHCGAQELSAGDGIWTLHAPDCQVVASPRESPLAGATGWPGVSWESTPHPPVLRESGTPEVDHDLKVWPNYFEPLLSGAKCHETREDDRGFSVGDVLRLREWDPTRQAYTGREVLRRVTYIAKPSKVTPIPEGYVVMSLGTATPPADPGLDFSKLNDGKGWCGTTMTVHTAEALQAQHRTLVAAAVQRAREEGWQAGQVQCSHRRGIEEDCSECAAFAGDTEDFLARIRGRREEQRNYTALLALVREWQEARKAWDEHPVGTKELHDSLMAAESALAAYVEGGLLDTPRRTEP